MPDDTPDTPPRSPSLTGQTIRFSEAVAGYDEPTQADPRGPTCPPVKRYLSETDDGMMRDYETEEYVFPGGSFVRWVDYQNAVTADRARLVEFVRQYGDEETVQQFEHTFFYACAAVDAKAREGR